MFSPYWALGLVFYILASRLVVRGMRGAFREVAFAALNLGALYGFFFYGQNGHYIGRFICYVALVLFQYAMLRCFAEKEGMKPWIAFWVPIAALICLHYLPVPLLGLFGHMVGRELNFSFDLVGLSYLAFRSSRLVLEVRNGLVKPPTVGEYINFCFFIPTMSVGPINTFVNYRKGFEPMAAALPIGRSALRVLIGFIKFEFLGSLCNQLTYSGLLLDDHQHHWIDLLVAVLFYYLYIYCNFSGFCDMAIGAAGLIGVPVPENFDNPFAARNVKDFWNRWHITLSVYMRDVVFAPLSKYLVRLLGPQNIDHAIALTIGIVFILIGIWHGAGWNFVVYGAVHALAVVANHYYTIFLKKRLGREGFKAYNANPYFRGVAVCLTFCYCAAALFLFANTPEDMKRIFASLK